MAHEHGVQRGDHVRVVEVLRGKIDGNRYDRQPDAGAQGDLLQKLLHHVQIQLVQQVVFFQHGNEFARGDDAPHGVHPAGQRLQRGGLARLYAHDGLVVYLDPFLLERLIEGLQDVLLIPVAVVRLAGVHGEQPVQVVADFPVGDTGPLHGEGGVRLPVVEAYAGLYAQRVAEGPGFDAGVRRFDCPGQVLDIPGIGDDDEVVLGGPGDHGARELILQHVRHQAEQVVALCVAVLGVVGAHAAHVKMEQRRLPVAVPQPFDPPVGEFVQIIAVGQPGHRVGVKVILLKQLVVFHQKLALALGV